MKSTLIQEHAYVCVCVCTYIYGIEIMRVPGHVYGHVGSESNMAASMMHICICKWEQRGMAESVNHS